MIETEHKEAPVDNSLPNLLENSDPDPEPNQRSTTSNSWALLIIGLVVGGLAGFFLHPLVFPEQAGPIAPLAGVESSAEINELDPYQSVMLAVETGARHYQGDPDAPVTIIEFGDFNCGYCAKWALEVLPQIDENYIQTGKVKIAYVHFPILGADSTAAASGTECAAEQGVFWDYHDQLYENIGIGYTPENLTILASELGLNTDDFAQCLAKFDPVTLEDDIRLSQVMGVRGTPAFLVNGYPLAGAYPYENFEEIIEQALANGL